jgi:hypothetical protein
MVFGQCQIDLVAELPAEAPPGFAELRREILGFVGEGEEGMLQVAGMHAGEEGGNLASGLFVVVTDEREYPWKGPFMREVSFFCFFCPFLSLACCVCLPLFVQPPLYYYDLGKKLLTVSWLLYSRTSVVANVRWCLRACLT